LGHLLPSPEDPVLKVDFRPNRELPKPFDSKRGEIMRV
jgi:hypothetical protein